MRQDKLKGEKPTTPNEFIVSMVSFCFVCLLFNFAFPFSGISVRIHRDARIPEQPNARWQ